MNMKTQSIKNISTNYNPTIDGLRGTAVLAVMLYHVSRDLLPGGYLGVDIFFVISGYLIMSIAMDGINRGNFSLWRFYSDRLGRLVPALLLLLVVTSFFALAILLPADLMGFSKSLLSVISFVPNIYFWRDTDYFSRLAEEKPLLHLWSLGVEGQFYVLFPLLLLLLRGSPRRRALQVVVTLSAGSFLLNVFALGRGAGAPAFFLLPTRFWEMGVGAIVALLPTRACLNQVTVNTLSLCGLGLVLVSLLHPKPWSANMPMSTVAVLGTALLIYITRNYQSLVEVLLSSTPLVFIGLISYSLYLWHWPILVYSRYFLVRNLELIEILFLFIAMLGVAVLSWRFVEGPFRKAERRRKTIQISIFISIILVFFSGIVLFERGLPKRLNQDASLINSAVGTHYRCPVPDFLAFGASRGCELNLPTRNPRDADIILLGNSHAQMYAPVWGNIFADKGLQGLLVPLNGCLPTVSANISNECIVLAERNLDEVLRLNRAKIVIVGLDWFHPNLVSQGGKVVENSENGPLIVALEDLIRRLRGADKKVIIIGPIAAPGWDVASVVSRQLAFNRLATRPYFTPLADFESVFGSTLRHFGNRQDIKFLRPDLVQCDLLGCHYITGGRSLFADGSHIAEGELGRFHSIFERSLAGFE